MYTPEFVAMLKAQVFSNLEHLEHRHLNLLLKHVLEPFVLYCPPEQYTVCITPVLSGALSHTLQRLTFLWGDSLPHPSGASPRVGTVPADPAHFISPPAAAFNPQGGFLVLLQYPLLPHPLTLVHSCSGVRFE